VRIRRRGCGTGRVKRIALEVPNAALGPALMGLWAHTVIWADGDGAGWVQALEHTGGFTLVEATRVAGTLLPDLLYYDPTRPASYPDNGRKPSDDAADAFLTVITNGKITGDGIGPHEDLLAEFPYLGPPHDGSR
jgi:hypothetical protein